MLFCIYPLIFQDENPLRPDLDHDLDRIGQHPGLLITRSA